MLKKLLNWFLGYRKCYGCGELKSPNELIIGVESVEGYPDICTDCFEELYFMNRENNG